ncbi:MAG: RadC family protein [Clostridia bacterium]|nr:RadC family protein [Clostridia bacterium]
MKKRFLENGGKNFSDHELLEMLLYHVIPRVDTNELAHALLNEFGTLRNVIYADPARIEQVVGAGRATSTFFSLLSAVKRRTDTQKYSTSRFIADTAIKVGNFLVDYYRDAKEEEFCVMLLDSSLGLIEFASLTRGSNNSAAIDVKALAKHALIYNATHVILAHNHPTGSALPSESDRELTQEVDSALSAVGIHLIEHVIVNGTGFKPTMYMRTLGAKADKHSSLYKRFYDSP